ncbi:hypothetical protein ACIQWN_37590 [Streptomyces vinaceus]|uniref:hypothetical protein n=1 Tax=Streptomyces vinaceus TaxID=1960 RepID=UPI003800E798
MNESDAVACVLEEAARLSLTPGYINGDSYDEWYVEASDGLLKALAALAATRGQLALTERLERFTAPMCLEVIDNKLCTAIVAVEGMPCSNHVPQNGASFGFCTYPASPNDEYPRMCKRTPRSGTDRCDDHEAYCRIVKKNGEVCGNWNCPAPPHRKARQAAAQR